jgi:hypothetical protein
MPATLTFAGLRIGEPYSLRWRDVNLAGGTSPLYALHAVFSADNYILRPDQPLVHGVIIPVQAVVSSPRSTHPVPPLTDAG